MSPVTPRLLDRNPDPLPRLRILQPLQRLGRPPRRGPAGNQRRERRTPRQIGVRVECDVDAPRELLINHGQQQRRFPPILGEVERCVGQIWPKTKQKAISHGRSSARGYQR